MGHGPFKFLMYSCTRCNIVQPLPDDWQIDQNFMHLLHRWAFFCLAHYLPKIWCFRVILRVIIQGSPELMIEKVLWKVGRCRIRKVSRKLIRVCVYECIHIYHKNNYMYIYYIDTFMYIYICIINLYVYYWNAWVGRFRGKARVWETNYPHFEKDKTTMEQSLPCLGYHRPLHLGLFESTNFHKLGQVPYTSQARYPKRVFALCIYHFQSSSVDKRTPQSTFSSLFTPDPKSPWSGVQKS